MHARFLTTTAFLMLYCLALRASANQPVPPLQTLTVLKTSDNRSRAELMFQGQIDPSKGDIVISLDEDLTREQLGLQVNAVQRGMPLQVHSKRVIDDVRSLYEIHFTPVTTAAELITFELRMKRDNWIDWTREFTVALDKKNAPVVARIALTSRTKQSIGSAPFQLQLYNVDSDFNSPRSFVFHGSIDPLSGLEQRSLDPHTSLSADGVTLWIDLETMNAHGLQRYVRFKNGGGLGARLFSARRISITEPPPVPPPSMPTAIEVAETSVGNASIADCLCRTACSKDPSVTFSALQDAYEPSVSASQLPYQGDSQYFPIEFDVDNRQIIVAKTSKIHLCLTNRGGGERTIGPFFSDTGQEGICAAKPLTVGSGEFAAVDVWKISCERKVFDLNSGAPDKQALRAWIDSLLAFETNQTQQYLEPLFSLSKAYVESDCTEASRNAHVRSLIEQLEELLNTVALNERLKREYSDVRSHLETLVQREYRYRTLKDPNRYYGEIMRLRRQIEKNRKALEEAGDRIVTSVR